MTPIPLRGALGTTPHDTQTKFGRRWRFVLSQQVNRIDVGDDLGGAFLTE